MEAEPVDTGGRERGETAPAGSKATVKRNTKFTPGRRKVFLESLKRRGSIRVGATDAKISEETARRHMVDDPAFREQVEQAKAVFYGHLLDAMRERAIDGVITKQQFDEDGNLVQEVRTFSDALLLAALKRHDVAFRDSFKIEATVDAKVEATAKQAIDLEQAMKRLSPELRASLRAALTLPEADEARPETKLLESETTG